MSAENEALVRRFFDPTGNSISVEAISIFRIADGKIAEEWTVWDALGLLQQVGAVPAAA
jgi:predicted ester cyclase